MSWIGVLFTITGSIKNSMKDPKMLRVFEFYLVADTIGLIYFGITMQWQYVVVNTVFIVIAINGIKNNMVK